MAGETIVFDIGFVDTDTAQASSHAAELREFLLDQDPAMQVLTLKSDPDAQDFGAVLHVILTAPSLILLARGLQKWISLRHTSSVTFRSGTKELVVTNLSSRRADELSQQLMALSTDSTSES